MKNMTEPYGVYVKIDERYRITDINSSAFLESAEGWTRIDEGYAERHRHAQGHYLEKPLRDERGILRYRLVLGVPQERTQEDMDADGEEIAEEKTDSERIAALEAQNAMLTECLLEMSMMLYA